MQKKTLTDGQKAYEAKRAAKAGVSLDKHLAAKDREKQDAAKAKAKAAEPPKPVKPPGILKRLIDRAHQPLKKDAASKKTQATPTKPAASPGKKTTAPAGKNLIGSKSARGR